MVACLVGVLARPETAGDTYELGGSELLSYGDLLRRTRAQLGHRLLLVPVPVVTPSLSAHWLRLVTDVPLDVARPLVEGLRNPVTAGDDRLFELLEVERTSLDAAIARALGPDAAGRTPPSPSRKGGAASDDAGRSGERSDAGGGEE